MKSDTVTIRIPTGDMTPEEQDRLIERLFAGCFADRRPADPHEAAAQFLDFTAELGAVRI